MSIKDLIIIVLVILLLGAVLFGSLGNFLGSITGFLDGVSNGVSESEGYVYKGGAISDFQSSLASSNSSNLNTNNGLSQLDANASVNDGGGSVSVNGGESSSASSGSSSGGGVSSSSASSGSSGSGGVSSGSGSSGGSGGSGGVVSSGVKYEDYQRDYMTDMVDSEGNPIYLSILSTSGGQLEPGIYQVYWSALGPINQTRIG